jgi:HEAT repeat protein
MVMELPMKSVTNLRAALFIALAIRCGMSAQVRGDRDLASLLANESTRREAVTKIVAAGSGKVSLLLSWARNPPADLNQHELYIGLADAFGQLRTKEAIPFLIKQIGLNRWRDVNTWLKTAPVIEERLPAAAALIRIGPEASKVLIRVSWDGMRPEDRLAAIFVVSRIASTMKDGDEERAFLHSAVGQANMERYWAEDGLKVLNGRR